MNSQVAKNAKEGRDCKDCRASWVKETLSEGRFSIALT